MKNKTLAILLAIILQIGLINVNASTQNWDSFGGNITNSKLNYAKLSTKINKTNINEVKTGDVKEPIIVNDKVYVVKTKTENNNSSLLELDLEGNIKHTIPLSGSVGHFSRIAYGDNKIFVPLSNRIEAIDINTRESLWTTKAVDYQMISSLLYYNGYLYSGVSAPGIDIDAPSDGYFFAINVKDDKANMINNQKGYAWTWQEDNKKTGFYWSSPVIVNNAILFIGDSGQLISHHLTKPEVYDKHSIEESTLANKSRSNIYYNKATDTIYVATQDSKRLFSMKMNKNMFNKDSIRNIKNDAVQFSGGIKGDGETIYASSGGMKANGGIIYRNNSLDTGDAILKGSGSQSLPLINMSKGKETLIYFVDYKSGNLVVAKKDNNKLSEIKQDEQINLEVNNSNSIIASEDGTMIVPLSTKGLMFINNNEKYNEVEMDVLLKSLPVNVEYSDKDKIEAISYQYDKYKSNTPHKSEALLNDAKNKIQTISDNKINEVENKINSLPTSLIDNKEASKDKIKEIRDVDYLFNGLYLDDQAKVSNVAKLTSILDKADAIEYRIAPEELIERINRLDNKENRLSDLKEVYAIEDEYNGVYYSEDTKEKVTNYQKLEKIKKELEIIGNDVNRVAFIIEELPPKITLNNDKEIQEAINIYQGLSQANKEDTNKGFKLKVKEEIIEVKVDNADYNYLLDCNKEIIRLKSVVTSGKNTYYYKLVDNKWFNYQMINRNGKTTTTYTYALDKAKLSDGDRKPGNGSRLSKSIIKSGSNTTTNLYQRIGNADKLYKTNTITRYRNKNITTYSRSISYYGNAKTKIDTKLYKSYKTNKMTSKNKTTYFSNGKRSVYIKFNYKNGKFSSRSEYRYNKLGQTRSNKYGKAYRYTTYYNKKGKPTKTMRIQYKANGKATKAKKVGKRNSF